MATAPTGNHPPHSTSNSAEAPPRAAKSRRRKTSHLKRVPETRELREKLRDAAGNVAADLDRSRPMSKDEMEVVARATLESLGLPEAYVGWMMVVLASAFWRDQVAAVPFSRRLFLLPHCLKHAEGCPADYDDFGLDCRKCGACTIADFRTAAEEMGYKVLVAEGSPIVLKIIVSGYVDAIVGVACLNVLEKAIDKILLAGIPCIAIPLLSSDCRNTSVDEEWVDQMIRIEHAAAKVQTRTYVHLMRAAAGMFEPDELARLAPRSRSGSPAAGGNGVDRIDPLAGTEAIGYDFLAKGGKHSRPFITLAAYDAMTGGNATGQHGEGHLASLPDHVKRTALSIETFHKASLVHDDIEDDDDYRYGDVAIHRRHGTATAINVGDYLIGLGYRLVSSQTASLGADVAADILDRLADAHTKLAEGQGAELLWRDARDKCLKPIDALKIYALKTAPAFEAALYAGLRMAAPTNGYGDAITRFTRNMGIAFQILNDLKDWKGDDDNKLNAGGDILGCRPTVLWALALDGLNDKDRAELESVVSKSDDNPDTVTRVRRLYHKAGVFEKSTRLVDKYQDRAEAVADEIEPQELRRLLYYLIDTVLDRPQENPTPVVELVTPTQPPVAASP